MPGQIFEDTIAQTIEPLFELSDEMLIGNKIVGDEFQVILNYKVIGQTKSFTDLRVLGIYLRPGGG